MRRQNSWTDPTIIGEHRGTLLFHRPEINSISGNVVIRPFPSHASKFPPRRLTTWLASPGLIRTRPLHPIERNWLHASHPLTIGEAFDCCGVSLPVPLFASRSFNERPLCANSGHSKSNVIERRTTVPPGLVIPNQIHLSETSASQSGLPPV